MSFVISFSSQTTFFPLSTRLSNLDQALLGNLTELQTTLASQLAVPTEKVYPQFARLASTWMGFQVGHGY